MRLNGKFAVITGAGSGIGNKTALKFIEHGANLILIDKNEIDLSELNRVKKDSQEILTYSFDVGSEKNWIDLRDNLISKKIYIDILVNNAGIGIEGNAETVLEKNLDLEISVNVKGPIWATKNLLNLFNDYSSIINISSIEGIVGNPNYLSYCATKAAVRNLTKSTALYFGEINKKIRINSVHPGYIKTPMVANDFDDYVKLHPIGRFGEANEIANVILFLASDESSFVHGSELIVDGGFLAK